MTIEEKIFNRTNVDFNKLSNYGFIKSDNKWIYTKSFMNDDFRAEISVDKHGNISGDVYEADSDDIYFPLRIESMSAGFAGKVRHEYESILFDIQKQCCRVNYFIFSQANRLAQKIYDTYGDVPTFPWDKFDGYGVFKNPDNDKWYALVMNISKNKLNKDLSGEVDVANIKLDESKIVDLLSQKGFYPAYHMNKKNWISIVLDDTISDDVLFSLLEESHSFTLGKRKERNTENSALG